MQLLKRCIKLTVLMQAGFQTHLCLPCQIYMRVQQCKVFLGVGCLWHAGDDERAQPLQCLCVQMCTGICTLITNFASEDLHLAAKMLKLRGRSARSGRA